MRVHLLSRRSGLSARAFAGGAAVALAASLVLVVAGCDQIMAPGSGGTAPDAAPAPGVGTCLDIRNCVYEKCGGATSPAMGTACLQDCIAKGTSNAQGLYLSLNSCLVATCCAAGKGCGGGEPRCNAAGTPACETCTCQAQCNASNAPCRQAAKSCYGVEPNCSTCR